MFGSKELGDRDRESSGSQQSSGTVKIRQCRMKSPRNKGSDHSSLTYAPSAFIMVCRFDLRLPHYPERAAKLSTCNN